MELNEHLTKIDGRQVIISKSTGKPLRYFKGEGKPSNEQVRNQEQSIEYFKHLGESMSSVESKIIRLYEKQGSEDLDIDLSNAFEKSWVAYCNAQSAHQNVKRGTFVEGHEIFKESYELLSDIIDEIAEGMRSVDLLAPSAFPSASLNITEYTAQSLSAVVYSSLKEVIDSLYIVSKKAEEDDQLGILNLIQGQITELEKLAQKLKSES